MTKRLYIRYGELELCDVGVDEFTWHESDGSVAVSGKVKPARASGSGIFDMITAASRRQTDTKRAELAAEEES